MLLENTEDTIDLIASPPPECQNEGLATNVGGTDLNYQEVNVVENDNASLQKESPKEEVWAHDQYPPIKDATKISYCQSCGFPKDFCEFGSQWSTCQDKALSSKYRKYYTNWLTLNGLPIESNETQSGRSKQTDEQQNNIPKPKKGKKQPTQQVTIQRVARARKKMATVITGLDLFGVKLDAAAKIFKKQFACGSSAVKGLPGQQDHVEIQGDFEDDLDSLIIENFTQVPADAIIHLKAK